jgi:hypothetical protein
MHPRKKTYWLLLLLCILLGGVLAALWVGNPVASFERDRSLQKLNLTCMDDMVRNTCTVMSKASSIAQKDKTDELIYIAGVGAVSAIEYQRIYDAGEGMCGVVLRKCIDDWDSAQCVTARKIYLR